MPTDVGSLLALSKVLMAISTPLTTSCYSPTLSPSLSSRFRLLLLLFVTLVSPANADSFYFKIKPKTNHVEEGHSVRLKCLVSDNKHIEYRWTLNHSPLELDTRRRQQDSDLVIQKVDAELDNGKFRCVATNKTSRYSLQSKAASVKVFYMSPNVSVNVVEPSQLKQIVIGGPLELHCATSAHPPVSPKQITWYVNYQRLKVATAKQLGIRLLDNGNLRILKVKPGNGGVYRCKVLHPAGEVMTVRPFPLIFNKGDGRYNTSNKPEDFIKYINKGDDLNLSCLQFNFSKSMIHFLTWTFTPSLDPKLMKVENINPTGKCPTNQKTCVLPQEKFVLIRRRMKKQSETGFFKCSMQPWQMKPLVIEVRIATNPRLPLNSLFPMSRPNRPVVVVKGKDLTIRLYQDVTPNKNRPTVPDPEPEYIWFRPNSNTPVPDYSSLVRQRIYKTKGRYLNVKNAREEDNGVYRLWIRNMAGVHKINVSVVVAFTPKFTDILMTDVLANEEGNTKFTCNVERMAQYPVAKIIWFKDNSRIPATSRLQEDDRLGILKITQVVITDEGTYHCAVYTEKMKNPLKKSNDFRLRVRRTLKILNQLKTKFVERGKHMSLPCTAQGEGVLYVSWWLNRQRIPSRPKAKNNIWANKGDLVIPSPMDQHAGNYTCIVSSRDQGRVNNTVQVIVGERPAIRSISTNLTVPEGRSVTLNCEATGDPRPKISWLKRFPNTLTTNLESITQDGFKESSRDTRRVMLSNGSLLIRRAILSDAAFYGCLAANPYALNSVKQLYLRVIAKESWAENGRDSSWSMTKTIIIVVGCAVAYLALIIGLTIYCSVRMLRNRQKRAAWAVAKMEGGVQGAPGAHENGRLMAMPNGESQGLMSAPDGGIGPGHGDSRSHFSSASAYTRSLRAGTPNSSLQDRMSTYPRHQLQTLGMLGKGEFGDVFLARAHNIRDGETESLVVVKAHHNGRSDTLDYEFHQQMDMCAKLDHDFVVKLLGVCREMEPEFMILEYCEWGDLKQFLKAMRQSDKECNERNVKIPPLTASQKVTMCSQVALGMEHLSNYRYVHKDLAARNVLLTSTLDLKISNLGLCQDVYAGEYFPMRNKRLPLRWLPSEVILEDAYSTKSDVWAFGILVYEVFTLGDIPHRRLTDLQVINAAETHYLVPELPAQCPAELASLLRQCWSDKPRERPSFNDISVIIGELTVDSDI